MRTSCFPVHYNVIYIGSVIRELSRKNSVSSLYVMSRWFTSQIRPCQWQSSMIVLHSFQLVWLPTALTVPSTPWHYAYQHPVTFWIMNMRNLLVAIVQSCDHHILNLITCLYPAFITHVIPQACMVPGSPIRHIGESLGLRLVGWSVQILIFRQIHDSI